MLQCKNINHALWGIDMRNQSSRQHLEQDVRKNEPNQSSPTSSVSGSVGGAAAAERQPSTLSDDITERKVVPFLTANEKLELASASQIHKSIIYTNPLDITLRNKKITLKLLRAVANGMESREVNVAPQTKDLFAEDLLHRSPEFVLEKGDFTDWGGRTFKNISAFEYALWARDFKMIDMMLKCITNAEERHRKDAKKGISEVTGDKIRAGLLEQYEQVTAPHYVGGGLTYELTYDRPVLDINGIPLESDMGDWLTTSVTETHTENHFDLNPLIRAYEDYDTHFFARTFEQRTAYWVKVIGTLQRLLPINILQRYCDPDMPFYPLSSFTGAFRRATSFINYLLDCADRTDSLLSSSLSSDFGLHRTGSRTAYGCKSGLSCEDDLAAIRRIGEVSTNEIEKIKQQLVMPGESPTQFRP